MKNKGISKSVLPEKPFFSTIQKLLTGIEPVTSTLPMLRTTDCAIAACSRQLPAVSEKYIIINCSPCQLNCAVFLHIFEGGYIFYKNVNKMLEDLI